MKATPYRQAVLIFGIVVPLLALGAVSAGTFIGRSKINSNHQAKVTALEKYNTANSQVAELEAFMTKDDRRDEATYWNEKLEKDVVASLSENLDKILAKYDPEVLRQTEMGQAAGAGGIASQNENPFVKMQLRFEGGYKPMQLLLAELENEMPHLVLDSITINPKSADKNNERGFLQFSVVYHCWENPGNTGEKKKKK